MGRDVEGYQELGRSERKAVVSLRLMPGAGVRGWGDRKGGGGRTVTRSRRGWMSRKMKQNEATRPPHATSSPKMSLRKLVNGVRFEKALDRRKRG